MHALTTFFSFSFDDFWANISRGFLDSAHFTTEPTFFAVCAIGGKGILWGWFETSWSWWQLNRSHALIATTMNSVVLGLLSIKAKTAKPTLKHIMMSLTLYKTIHDGLYHIQHTPNECFNRFSFLYPKSHASDFKFWIISEKKLKHAGKFG